MITISHDYLMLIILLLILLYGTIKYSFKKILIIMLICFVIDIMLGYPFQNALNFNLFEVLMSPFDQFNLIEIITRWIIETGKKIVNPLNW